MITGYENILSIGQYANQIISNAIKSVLTLVFEYKYEKAKRILIKNISAAVVKKIIKNVTELLSEALLL